MSLTAMAHWSSVGKIMAVSNSCLCVKSHAGHSHGPEGFTHTWQFDSSGTHTTPKRSSALAHTLGPSHEFMPHGTLEQIPSAVVVVVVVEVVPASSQAAVAEIL